MKRRYIVLLRTVEERPADGDKELLTVLEEIVGKDKAPKLMEILKQTSVDVNEEKEPVWHEISVYDPFWKEFGLAEVALLHEDED